MRIEPFLELLLVVAVTVHEQRVEKTAAVGMRLANARPLNVGLSVLVAGVPQIQALDQLSGVRQMPRRVLFVGPNGTERYDEQQQSVSQAALHGSSSLFSNDTNTPGHAMPEVF